MNAPNTSRTSPRGGNRFREVWQQLHDYGTTRGWRGYDPYDALNSPVACLLPGKLARQAWTQLHRRSPVNLRPFCGIRPTLNPKALALAALGSGDGRWLDELERLRTSQGGWGYPFAWQSRAFYAPRGTPNLICTAFAARAYERLERACDISFLEKNLLRERAGERWLTYVLHSDTQVHNVNMVGAALLGRKDCLEFSVKRQRADGSWWYGESENQHWIDNFHTGYSLVALKDYEAKTGDRGFADSAARGFAFWEKTFWRADGAPRYYHNADHPFDTHCSAQGIVTFLAFGRVEQAVHVAEWAVENMWDTRGFFWYQRGQRGINRLCYMRWTQAWMYYALAELLAVIERDR
ncbi:MAG TPA: hypothetical protein VMV72_08430 [Verrucomicrobiae bacterium]|nr:hypothetical protein [Verrucomicrobiae bacterium]